MRVCECVCVSILFILLFEWRAEVVTGNRVLKCYKPRYIHTEKVLSLVALPISPYLSRALSSEAFNFIIALS